MDFPVFQVINYTLILIVFILLIRYIWGVFFDDNYQPAEWKFAMDRGHISKKLKRLERQYPDKVRFFNWWFQVGRLKQDNVPGDFAEVGVYKGDSARVIHHCDPGRHFHLFDTFTGFPMRDLATETGPAATYTPENFSDTAINKVLQHIGGNENVRIYPGYFPDTAGIVVDFRFALVNLDADLYNPTRAALDFFYPRLSPGGMILIHDYNHQWPGIVKAVDEFLMLIPETLVRIPDMDGTVMIIRNKEC